MLSTMRSSWLLFTLLALVALSHAWGVEDALSNLDGINAYLHNGAKRQAEGTGATPSPTSPTTSSDEPSSTPTSTPASSSETTPEASSTPSSEASTTAASTTSSSRTTTTPVVSTRPLVSTEVAPTTTIVTYISNGQTVATTSVGSRTVEHTTGTATETSLPNTQNDDSSSGGLSSTNKSIIGGVIGGVGGAILLGGIAIVCWRIWGRKKRVTEDDADLMAGTGAALGDKSHNNASPFQSNLEQYHNPGGRPNAAANF